jgi:hypothetical protein
LAFLLAGYFWTLVNYLKLFEKFDIRKKTVAEIPSNLGLILKHITILNEVLTIYLNFSGITFIGTEILGIKDG